MVERRGQLPHVLVPWRWLARPLLEDEDVLVQIVLLEALRRLPKPEGEVELCDAALPLKLQDRIVRFLRRLGATYTVQPAVRMPLPRSEREWSALRKIAYKGITYEGNGDAAELGVELAPAPDEARVPGSGAVQVRDEGEGQGAPPALHQRLVPIGCAGY